MSNVSPPDDESKTEVMPAEPVEAIRAGEAEQVLREALGAAALAFDRLEALSVGIARALDATAANPGPERASP